MPSLRVGIVTTSYPLNRGSSSGVFIKSLVEHLPQDISARIVTPAGARPAEPARAQRVELTTFRYAPYRYQLLAHQPGGIPVALRNRPWSYGLLPAFLCSMLVACLRVARRCDVVHANWAVPGVVAGLAGRLVGVPVMTTLRGEDVNRISTSRSSRTALRLCLALSSRAVTVGEKLRQHVLGRFPKSADKLSTIPNGVSDALLALEPSRGDGPLHLLSIGSLIPRKGNDLILRALGLLPPDVDFRLTIVGAGPELSSLRDLACRQGVAELVEFAGAVAPEDVAGHLQAADVLLLGSRAEGRPNVVLEAMAAALPVVATRIDGVRELVRDGVTGYLVEADDAPGFADRIARLGRHPDLRDRLGRAGRATIVENSLTWRESARRYAELYRELAASEQVG